MGNKATGKISYKSLLKIDYNKKESKSIKIKTFITM